MRSLLFVIISILLLPLAAIADTPQELFEKANEAYKENRYGDAVILYEEIVDMGEETANVHYNLGNAYFRMDNLPYAILHFERALKLDPGASDARQNLAIANARTVDRIEPIPQFFLTEFFEDTVYTSSSGFWSWMAIFCFWLAIGLLSLFIIGRSAQLRKLGLFSGLFVLLISIFLFIAAWQADYHENLRTDAIVMTASAYVRSEPNEDSQELFILHEGTKAEILGLEDGYFKIRIADGNQGWISQAEMERI